MNKILIITLFIVCLSIKVQSQSVETFIEMALQNNPGLESLKLEYDAALLKADQEKDWPDPKINLGIGVLPVETRLGAQMIRIGATQMIPWKGLLDARSKVSKSMAEVKSNKDDLREIDIEFSIRTAYNTLQYIESQKEILNQKMIVLDALEDLAKSSVRSGKGKVSNVLLIERKREILNSDLDLLSKKMEQPTIMINRWTGRSLEDKIELTVQENILLVEEEIKQYAMEEHPQLKMYNDQISASRTKIELTRFESKPKIGVGLEYAYVDKRNDVDIPNNGRDILMPMGSISIPLHTNRFEVKRQEETLLQKALQAKGEDTKDRFISEIQLAYSTSEYADQVIEKYQSLKKITDETIKLMRSEYASEGTRFEELLRLEMELIDYDMEIINAQYEKNLARVVLYKFR